MNIKRKKKGGRVFPCQVAALNSGAETRDSQSFYNYYNDIARRVKHRQVDVLLVVNMFLTGFDSAWLNTLYVDKNLRYHGLIQAFSRTNRIPDAFFSFWDQEQQAAIRQLIAEENLDEAKTQKVIGDYLFTEQTPLRDEIIGAMKERPSLKDRGSTAERITARILEFVETFISGMVGK